MPSQNMQSTLSTGCYFQPSKHQSSWEKSKVIQATSVASRGRVQHTRKLCMRSENEVWRAQPDARAPCSTEGHHIANVDLLKCCSEELRWIRHWEPSTLGLAWGTLRLTLEGSKRVQDRWNNAQLDGAAGGWRMWPSCWFCQGDISMKAKQESRLG